MEKRGLITVKQSKKEDRITTVNREHEVYKSFQQELAKEGPATATANDATATATQKKATRLQGKHIEVFEMFKPVSNLRPVFGEAAVANKDALFSREEVKTALMRYTQQQALSAEGSRDALKLDKLLKSGLYGKKEPVEVGTLVKIRDVFDRLMTKMQLYHKVVCEEADGAQEEVIRKGKIKNIHVLTEDRHAGRKFITRVTHLESFAIDPQEFAGNLQRTFKCSSTVQKLPGKNETGREVSLQGNLLHEICNYLECQCGIHPKFIEKTSKMR
jgi:translation initiation factor 2D